MTGIHAGVKKKAGVLDLAIILSSKPASAAGCFTRNAFKAAPVVVSQQVLAEGHGRARALVVNSGCANAVTGAQGMEDAWAMARAATVSMRVFKVKALSTGVLIVASHGRR